MLATALARHLHGLQLVELDETGATGDCFVGTMPSKPDEAVAVMPSGGFGQPTRNPTDLPTVQILVRAGADPRTSYDRARAIYGAVTCLDHVTLDEGGLDEVYVIGTTALQTDPVPLGKDANQRHEWSLNFAFRVHAPTAHRPAYA